MMQDKKIWAVLVELTKPGWNKTSDALPFDECMWSYILDESVKSGVNMIVLEVGNGIQYASHPEISPKGAWSRNRVREEVKRCRDLGIELVPELNFATPHGEWLGEYARMVSTNIYYRVANDLIKEVHELFDHPRFIHLGFDEEDAQHVRGMEYALFRQKELFWHDLNFLLDCVADTGARPWIWSCPLFTYHEEYKKHIGVKDAVLSPWYYNAFRKEHWTPVTARAVTETYYNQGIYKDMNIRYVEEDPFLVNFREVALPLMEEGYDYIPCASVCNRCDYNHMDLMEYFRDNAPDNQVLGYITAPWCATSDEKSKQYYEESFRFLKEAKEAIYG